MKPALSGSVSRCDLCFNKITLLVMGPEGRRSSKRDTNKEVNAKMWVRDNGGSDKSGSSIGEITGVL